MTASPAHSLKERIADIQSRIRAAAEKAGRDPASVTLLAATKTIESTVILDAIRLGITHIGENRVQEAQSKRPALASAKVSHHFIGQLQTNKARVAVEFFDVIQCVDRFRLAEAISRAAQEQGKTQRCLIEIKVSDEESKGGMAAAEADVFIENVSRLPNLSLEGIMTIAPFDRPAAETSAAFALAADVFNRNRRFFGDTPVLSMGMTDDLELAIAQGSTMVRVGRALFGERIYVEPQ